MIKWLVNLGILYILLNLYEFFSELRFSFTKLPIPRKRDFIVNIK